MSPTLSLQPEDFVLLLTHTPDYVEDVDVSIPTWHWRTYAWRAGQSVQGWTPPVSLNTGIVFDRSEEKQPGIPVIISNGIGTSRKDVRLFTPSEVVLIVLHKE